MPETKDVMGLSAEEQAKRYIVYINNLPAMYVWATSYENAQAYAQKVGGIAYLSPPLHLFEH